MPARLDMDFPTSVPEAKQVAGHGRDWVALIVRLCESSDLGVKECFQGRTANLTSPKPDAPEALNRHPCRAVGRPSLMNNASSSACAPPMEWPIDA